MAKFRMIHTEFWNDPRVVEEFTPEDKLFYLYLLTNSKTTQIGIYQITKKQMAFDMGYSIETVNSLVDRFEKHHEIIVYNPDTREIAIKNWGGKYNFNRGGKPVLDCVTSELKEVKDKNLIQLVAERIEKKEIRAIYDSYNDTSDDTSSDTSNDTDNESQGNKKQESHDSNSSYDTSDDSSTIRGQEKEEEEEKEEEKEEQQQKELYGGGLRDEEFGEVVHFYKNNLQIGVSETSFNMELIQQFFNEWGSELLLAAMKLAAQKEAKGTAYVEAVLKRWKEYGVKNVEDARAYQRQLRKKSPYYPNNPKQDIKPDWYDKHKQETQESKQELSDAEKEKAAAEADKMLQEYLAEQTS